MDKNQLIDLAFKINGECGEGRLARETHASAVGSQLKLVTDARKALEQATRVLHLTVAASLNARPVTMAPGNQMFFKALYKGQPRPSALAPFVSAIDWEICQEDRLALTPPTWKFIVEVDPDQPGGYSSSVEAWSLDEAIAAMCKDLLENLPERVNIGDHVMVIDIFDPAGNSCRSGDLIEIKAPQ